MLLANEFEFSDDRYNVGMLGIWEMRNMGVSRSDLKSIESSRLYYMCW